MKSKRVYSKPQLKDLGSLKTLVMGASGTQVESGAAAMRFNL